VAAVEIAGIKKLKIYNMANTKKEIIEEIEGILKANKDNIYCDEYQIAEMIKEVLKLYGI
jgi:hypothetical protein